MNTTTNEGWDVVPDGMPTLSYGDHEPGQGRACVMEYVALLAGEEWTDAPQCTNDWLATAARAVNDTLVDESRHLLVPLIGRLLGTTAPTYTNEFDLTASQLVRDCIEMYDVDGERAANLVGRLSDLIDMYDRLTGRGWDEQTVPEPKLRELATTVEAGPR